MDGQADGGGGQDAALTTSDGLAASSGAPVYAVSGIAGLLERLLPGGTRTFPVVSNSVEQNFEDNTVSPYSGGSQITSISSDGNGGFHLTALVDGEEIVIKFPADSFTDEGGWERFMVEMDGDEFVLSDRTGSFDEADKTRGDPDHAYFDILELFAPLEEHSTVRINFTFGARTPADGMPKGTATYYGSLHITAWNAADPDHELRQYYDGDLTLAADFIDSSVSGFVNGLEHEDEVSRRESKMSEDNRIDITNGQIAGGRFVADWQGQGPEGGIADTVRGLKGQLLGEFYGPGAEEVAGVVNGQRAATGSDPAQIVHGHFSGGDDGVVDIGDPTISGEIGPQIARKRDLRELKQRITDPAASSTARVTAIEPVSGGGVLVTYVIDGSEQMIKFEEPAADDRSPDVTDESGREFGLDRWPGIFNGDHFNIFVNGASNIGCEDYCYMAFTSAVGEESDPERLVTLGSATYSGNMWAELAPPNGGLSRNYRRIWGDMALKADFAAGDISGLIDGLEMRPSRRESGIEEPPWADLPDSNSILISDGQIIDSRFTASWQGQDTATAADPDMSVNGFAGDMAGAFYGPDGEEVAGVVGGDGNGWQVMGGFAGVRDTSGTEN